MGELLMLARVPPRLEGDVHDAEIAPDEDDPCTVPVSTMRSFGLYFFRTFPRVVAGMFALVTTSNTVA